VSAGNSSRIVRFGIFEVDLKAGELRRSGLKIKVQEQPFQILAVLLKHPGEVITREELRSELWSADTFVDFDHSLNAAIKRLRDALGESAERPIFVETVARRGYRFIGNVEIPTATPSALSDLNALKRDTETGRITTRVLPTGSSGRWARGWQFAGAVLAIVVMASMAGGWFLWRHASRSKLSQASVTLRRLTTNATENWIIASAISLDGGAAPSTTEGF
jgi:DNA-binding winged helix-turn-helix (wHTH) protein